MLYNFLSWGMITFGTILFFTAYEFVRFMETPNEIIGMLFIGIMGGIMFGFGVMALWEQWKKRV